MTKDKELREERARDNADSVRNGLEAKLEEVTARVQELEDKEGEAKTAAREKNDELNVEEDRGQKAKELLNLIRQELAELRAQRNDLVATKASDLAKFHQNMPAAMEAIKRNRNQFKDMPIGPLGIHVKVKRQEWAKLCEVIFGKNLNGFLVTNFEDQQALRSILHKTQW
jgi:structural maintenance of chromosomes protein 6